jgi:hypothetical protein
MPLQRYYATAFLFRVINVFTEKLFVSESAKGVKFLLDKFYAYF